MTDLLGKFLLGSQFYQDRNPAYIKIDGVTMGESSEYGWMTIYGKDIGKILDECLQDSMVIAVVYNWKAGVAYTKTGVAYNTKSDSKINSEYTTFIKKQESDNKFVRTFGSSFQCDNQPFTAVGFNAFFLGLLQETMTWPSHDQITEIFEAAKRMKATVVRSHTLGFSAQGYSSLLDKMNYFNPKAWDSIDWAFAEAKRCGIKLIPVLTDPYNYYHGSYETFCAPYNIPKDQFFTSPIARDNFKQYIFGYLNHVNPYTNIAIKNCTDVCMLELGNELGDYRPDSGSIAVPTQDWITDIATYIKTMTPILVLDGSDECLGSQISNNFKITQVDCYSRHFYYEDYDAIALAAKNSSAVGKPFIIGEYSSKFDSNWFTNIEKIRPYIRGSLAWSMYPHAHNAARVNHGDGFDFWFDFYSKENNAVLLNLTNHFRRMQQLPTINDITQLYYF